MRSTWNWALRTYETRIENLIVNATTAVGLRPMNIGRRAFAGWKVSSALRHATVASTNVSHVARSHCRIEYRRSRHCCCRAERSEARAWKSIASLAVSARA